MNIYLIGYRSAGKTTIGKRLSSLTGLSFFDTDEQISNFHKLSISEIVRRYGWSYFRNREKEALSYISFYYGFIVATGGGVVLDKSNIDLMKSSGCIIWLKTSLEEAVERIYRDVDTIYNRPSLTGKAFMDDIEDTFDSRIQIYNDVSDISVATDHFSPEVICKLLCEFFLKKWLILKRLNLNL